LNNSFYTDVLIIGAGAAGIAAATASVEAGASVIVVEKLNYPGGRATASAVGTICGLFLRGEKEVFSMNGLPKEFALNILKKSKKEPQRFSEKLWFIPCQANHFRSVAEEYLSHQKINILYNTEVKSISQEGGLIDKIIIENKNVKQTIFAKAYIDCSGVGVTLSLLKHPLILDKQQQAAAVVFQANGILSENEFSLHHLIIKYITQAIKPGSEQEFYKLISIIPGSLKNGSAQFKLGIPWTPEGDPVELNFHAHKFIHEVLSFLKSGMPQFENASLAWIADEVGQRSGARPIGREILKEEDVLTCKKRTDEICKGSWPIEFWEIGNKKVNMTYFPQNDYYSIPASCLISNTFTNLFFGGKLISASEKAIASARVIGTCLGTGYAAGILATYKSMGKSEQEGISFIQNRISI